MSDETTPNSTTTKASGESRMQELLTLSRDVLRHMLDPQVPWATKLIPVLAIIYLLSPVDLIPDTIPLITQIDDLAVLLIAAKLFMELVPDDVDETPTVEASYRVQEGEE